MACTVSKLWHSLYHRYATVVMITVLLLETWESSYVLRVINSSFGAIFAQTAGFNMAKTLTIYVFISSLVLIEQNTLNLVMFGDMHMQLSHCYCYCFVVENMKLCIINIWYSHEKKIDPLTPNISIHLHTAGTYDEGCLTIRIFFLVVPFFSHTDMFDRTVSL